MATASSKRPLKVGLFFPHAQIGAGGRVPHWTNVLALARHAEQVGFDSLWFPDHYYYPGSPGASGADRAGEDAASEAAASGRAPSGFWDCWTMLAALAATVPRVELGTLVTCTGYRSPAVLAKIVSTVEEISGGRVILGIGAGDHGPEHHAFGFPYDNRVGRFEEALTIILALLRTGACDFTGTHYQVHELELMPRGPRPNGPPIMIGTLATGKRMLRLTAQHADLWNGWIIRQGSRPDLLPPLRAAVDAACVSHGRDPATLGRTLTVGATVLGREMPGTATISGTPEAMAETFRAFAREGISHVQIWLTPSSRAGVEAFAPVLELLDRG